MDDDESETAEKGEREAEEKAKLKTKKLWDRLRAQTRAIIEKTSYGKTKYWSPAIGKYVNINSVIVKQFNIMHQSLYRYSLVLICIFQVQFSKQNMEAGAQNMFHTKEGSHHRSNNGAVTCRTCTGPLS